MPYQLFIGIDTSKDKYDFHYLDQQGNPQLYGEVANSSTALKRWLEDVIAAHDLSPSEVLICIERSGIYSLNLACLAHELGFHVWLEDALHLSKSFGRTRGKTDAIDAARIAKYAQRNWQDVSLFQPLRPTISQIKSLVGQRKRLIKAKNILLVPINEEQDFLPGLDEELHAITTTIVKQTEQAIKDLDQQIDTLIRNDEQLRHQEQLATSVPGFKKVNFRNLVITTEGFTRLNNARALACQIGIAPFPRQSGKCLNKKPTTGKMGDKSFKASLTCAVRSIIKSNNHFGRYYRRKIAQGKDHLVVVNALRNKIIHTVMACINNNTKYEENYSHKLA
ncbi:MAG: IS110 family transposase [Bacteroidota bacterium]